MSAHARRSTAAILLCVVGLLVLTGLDFASKQWALSTLSQARPGERPPLCEVSPTGRIEYQRQVRPPVVLAPHYLEFLYAENCGAAFGLIHRWPASLRRTVFGIAALLASGVLLVMFVRRRGGRLFAYSVPFIVSGALGNLIDRLRYGYVVDFIRVHVDQKWGWPTFNVADATITIGVALLLLDGIVESRRARSAEAKADEAPPSEPAAGDG